MNEEILNTVYSASLEFGENFHKPIIDIVAELYPYIPDDEKTAIADYIGQTRDAIEQYFYDKYDYKNETANKELQHQGKQWIENKCRCRLYFRQSTKTESPINSYTQSLKFSKHLKNTISGFLHREKLP